jgi:cell division protease FtsH
MDLSKHKNYSEELARDIDNEVSLLVKDSYKKAKEILLANKPSLETLIAKLLEKEVVDSDEIDEIMGIKKAEKPAAAEDAKPAQQTAADGGHQHIVDGLF